MSHVFKVSLAQTDRRLSGLLLTRYCGAQQQKLKWRVAPRHATRHWRAKAQDSSFRP